MGSGCEAEYHHKDCPCSRCKYKYCEKCPEGITLSKDHITPRSIRRAWNIPINGDGKRKRDGKIDTSNIQMLNPQCHRLKDTSTPSRTILAKRLGKGKPVTHADYFQAVLVHDLRDADTGKSIFVPANTKITFK